MQAAAGEAKRDFWLLILNSPLRVLGAKAFFLFWYGHWNHGTCCIPRLSLVLPCGVGHGIRFAYLHGRVCGNFWAVV